MKDNDVAFINSLGLEGPHRPQSTFALLQPDPKIQKENRERWKKKQEQKKQQETKKAKTEEPPMREPATQQEPEGDDEVSLSQETIVMGQSAPAR